MNNEIQIILSGLSLCWYINRYDKTLFFVTYPVDSPHLATILSLQYNALLS